MNQYFLKFSTEQVALDALTQAGLVIEGEVDTSNPLISLDIIGGLVEPAVYSDDGVMLVEPQPLEGFHVNVLCESLPASLDDYIVIPQRPIRVFAV